MFLKIITYGAAMLFGLSVRMLYMFNQKRKMMRIARQSWQEAMRRTTE